MLQHVQEWQPNGSQASVDCLGLGKEQCLTSHPCACCRVTVLSVCTFAYRPRVVECLLTLRRIYEVERNDGKRSPRRPFALSPRSGTPNVSGHQPLRLSQRHSSPFLATPDVNYQAVQQV